MNAANQTHAVCVCVCVERLDSLETAVVGAAVVGAAVVGAAVVGAAVVGAAVVGAEDGKHNVSLALVILSMQ